MDSALGQPMVSVGYGPFRFASIGVELRIREEHGVLFIESISRYSRGRYLMVFSAQFFLSAVIAAVYFVRVWNDPSARLAPRDEALWAAGLIGIPTFMCLMLGVWGRLLSRLQSGLGPFLTVDLAAGIARVPSAGKEVSLADAARVRFIKSWTRATGSYRQRWFISQVALEQRQIPPGARDAFVPLLTCTGSTKVAARLASRLAESLGVPLVETTLAREDRPCNDDIQLLMRAKGDPTGKQCFLSIDY